MPAGVRGNRRALPPLNFQRGVARRDREGRAAGVLQRPQDCRQLVLRRTPPRIRHLDRELAPYGIEGSTGMPLHVLGNRHQ